MYRFLLISFCLIFLFSFNFQSQKELENANDSICQSKKKWGFFGHRKINRMAVFTLPPPLISFYKKNIEYITAHAVDPDKRRYATKHEAVRHYIDLDVHGTFPFENLPKDWTGMLAKFTSVYVVKADGDTNRLILNELIHQDSFQINEKIFQKENLDYSIIQILENEYPDKTIQSLLKYYYRTFFKNNILSQYYEDELIVDCDSLKKYFGHDIDCQSAFAIDTFSQHGILPYHLQQMQVKLKYAFEDRNLKRILQLSSEFGHYIGDAHVPLHTTENYNGQLTDQYGIHGFWESRLPELYADETYDFWVGKAGFIEDSKDYYWNIVLTSHSYVDSVLQVEKDLFEEMGQSKFCYDERSNQVVRIECRDYAEFYHNRLDGMVEKRMKDAVLAIGTAWHTAWLEAGAPDLNNLKTPAQLEEEEEKRLEEAFQKGKILGRNHN